MGERFDAHAAEPLDRSRFERSSSPGRLGPRRQHHRIHLEPSCSHRLDRQQGVVDRPEPGGCRDHHAEVRARGRSRGRGSRGSAAPASRRPPRRRAGRRRAPASAAALVQPSRVDRLAGQLGAEVGRDRRPVAIGRDLVVGLTRAGGAAQQLVVGLAAVVEAADRRLEHGDPSPAVAAVRAITAATTVLPTSVPVPVTKTPSTGHARLRREPCVRRRREAVRLSARRRCPQRPGRARRGRSPRGGAQLVGTVARHHGQAQPRASLGHGRRPDRLGEDAAVEGSLAERHRASRVADDHRHDLGPRAGRAEALGAERLAQAWRRCGAAARPGRGASRAARARRARRRPTAAAGAVEKMNGREVLTSSSITCARGADVRAVAAQRLAQRADDDVDLAAEPGRGNRRRARPARARRCRAPRRPRAWQPYRRARLDQLDQRRDVAVHREDAVGDDQLRRDRRPARARTARCSRSRWR